MKRIFAVALLLVSFVASSAFAQGRRPSVIVTAEPIIVQSGGPSTLHWEATNATSVTVGTDSRFYTYRDSLRVPLIGSMVVKPLATTTYYVIARKRMSDLNDNGRSDGIRRSTRVAVTVHVQ